MFLTTNVYGLHISGQSILRKYTSADVSVANDTVGKITHLSSVKVLLVRCNFKLNDCGSSSVVREACSIAFDSVRVSSHGHFGDE